METEAFFESVRDALQDRDARRVQDLCDALATEVRRGTAQLGKRDGRKVLSFLKGNRCFEELVSLGATLTKAHPGDDKIRRLYAQGLIDAGHVQDQPELMDEALVLLQRAVADSGVTQKELEEAWGLIGRVHKQKYVGSLTASDESRRATIGAALEAYGRGWDSSQNPWHGINLVAVLARATRDGVEVESEHDVEALAEQILADIEDRDEDGTANLYDYATAMEACLALGRLDASIEWGERYVSTGVAAGKDEFEFASTLRQLREVWGLDPDGPEGSALLPMLQAAVVHRGLEDRTGSGSVQADPRILARMRAPETTRHLERVFGQDSFVTGPWIRSLLDRLQAIGSVLTPSGKLVGTGFALEGGRLAEALAGEWIFVTNSHVVTDADEVVRTHGAARPSEVIIEFTEPSEEDARTFKVEEIIWTSPPEELDVTLLKLDQAFYEEVDPYPIAEHLTDPSKRPRVYIAGHPGTHDLMISMHDNHLIEFDERLMLYRTPTNPGSSGSPVFNEEWFLVGLHRAGSEKTARLDGSGVQEANEGVRLSAIITALGAFLGEGSSASGAPGG